MYQLHLCPERLYWSPNWHCQDFLNLSHRNKTGQTKIIWPRSFLLFNCQALKFFSGVSPLKQDLAEWHPFQKTPTVSEYSNWVHKKTVQTLYSLVSRIKFLRKGLRTPLMKLSLKISDSFWFIHIWHFKYLCYMSYQSNIFNKNNYH